jgi:hypothetical protein
MLHCLLDRRGRTFLSIINANAFAMGLAALCLLSFQHSVHAQEVLSKAQVVLVSKHGVSLPLRDIAPISNELEPQHEIPLRMSEEPLPAAPNIADPVLQAWPGPLVGTRDGLNFAGLGEDAYGFRVSAAPPDTNGAVGDTQFMQWVNSSFALFDKSTGDLLYGPALGITLFSGFGAPCEARNGGDGVILYDKAAGRWLFSQLNASPTTVCIALSTSSDATGTYFQYAFDLADELPPGTTLSDYPKFGVWPDGYYYTANIFGATGGIGTNLCAFDRASMLLGSDASAQCFFSTTVGASYLPADLDGNTPPPDGSPNFLVDINNSGQELRLLKFHVDWDIPDNSALTGPIHIPVAPFTRATGSVPQFDSSQGLATLGDRLMFRLAYRNFGDHESLLMNHSVAAKDVIGVRWYELQNPSGDVPILFQQGTYAPDSTYRWMGSIAMDQAGNIAVGYSASSADIYPAIRYTGRTPDDPLGMLDGENSIIEGTGSQQPSLARWGDYSSLTVDPVDDCTFWFTTEYLETNGTFNWNTRIASFVFPSCGFSRASDQRIAGLSRRTPAR